MQPQTPQSPPSETPAGTPPALPTLPMPPSAATVAAAPAQPATPTATAPVPAVQGDSPAIADDGDLIEKEWVSQVKRIITKTTHDPYEQNKQLAKLKADYMQKRYGKVIKWED